VGPHDDSGNIGVVKYVYGEMIGLDFEEPYYDQEGGPAPVFAPLSVRDKTCRM
jgi:hypothetical protein